jgi:hypothetical protein
MEHIIQRDFFPNLPALRHKVEVAKAIQSGDFVRVNQLAQAGTPNVGGGTPASIFEGARTPMSTVSRDTVHLQPPPSPSPSVASVRTMDSSISNRTNTADINMSLDAFASTYTSEDNASFDKIMEKESALKRQKYAWMYEAEIAHNQMMLEHLPSLSSSITLTTSNIPMLLTDKPSSQEPHADTTASTVASEGKELAIVVDKQPTQPSLIEAKPGGPKNPLGWKYKAMNELMFGPQDHIPFRPDEINAGPSREINHSATRFTHKPTVQNAQVSALIFLQLHCCRTNNCARCFPVLIRFVSICLTTDESRQRSCIFGSSRWWSHQSSYFSPTHQP